MNQDSTIIRQIFKPTGCLSREQLMAYADGRLEGEELRIAEHHLNDCEICNLALEAVLETGTENFHLMLTATDSRIESRVREGKRRTAPGRIGWRVFVSAAASIILLAVIGWYFLFSGPDYPGMAQYWFSDTYHSTVTHGSEDHDTYQEGLELLQKEEYGKAIRQLERSAGELSGVQLKDYEWFRALAYLGAGQAEKAYEMVAKISVDSESDFQDAAKELRMELDAVRK